MCFQIEGRGWSLIQEQARLLGLKPAHVCTAYAALKGRSSLFHFTTDARSLVRPLEVAVRRFEPFEAGF
jgi:hypothetical protein